MARPDNLFETDNQNAHAPSDEQIAAMPPIFRRIWESIIASQRAQIGPVRIAEGDAGWQKAAREQLGGRFVAPDEVAEHAIIDVQGIVVGRHVGAGPGQAELVHADLEGERLAAAGAAP